MFPALALLALLSLHCAASPSAEPGAARSEAAAAAGRQSIANDGWASVVVKGGSAELAYTTTNAGQRCRSCTCASGDRWVRVSAHHLVGRGEGPGSGEREGEGEGEGEGERKRRRKEEKGRS